VFNVSGGEIIVILLLALVVLGPEKLPEALRRAGRTYAELKKMGNSFQTEMRSVLDEPMKEMRDTADLLRKAVDVTVETATTDTRAPKPTPAVVDEPVPEVAAAVAEFESVDGDPPADPATNTAVMDDEVQPAPTPLAEPRESAERAEPAERVEPAPPPAPRPVAQTVASADDDLINRTLSGD
jgi:sec-independent protein translocase protein TatB